VQFKNACASDENGVRAESGGVAHRGGGRGDLGQPVCVGNPMPQSIL